MLAGHGATGLLAGAKIRQVSAGTWILAAVLADLLVFVFVLTGIERIEFLAGRGAARYFHPLEIGFSHSLASGVLFGGLFALALIAVGHRRRVAVMAAALVIGHWALDVISHPPDMPLAPGLTWRAGLGLWTSIPVTLAIEGGLWFAAVAIYAPVCRQHECRSPCALLGRRRADHARVGRQHRRAAAVESIDGTDRESRVVCRDRRMGPRHRAASPLGHPYFLAGAPAACGFGPVHVHP